MTPVDIAIKLNRDFNTMDTNEIDQLALDSKSWESKCVQNSEDKIQSLYFKLFKSNPLTRLIMGLAYFWVVKELKKIFNNNSSDEDFEFED